MIKLTRIYNRKFSQLKGSEYLRDVQGYKLLSSNYSEDFKIQVNQLLHKSSGAKVYHLQTNDQDNTFATVFKTFPSDSKGCPHILEHLACCGSKKYPIRDPFFNMLKRSVNTYMNAWTGQDFTCYPFSSTNPKDWTNLFSVYTDMSFKPLLNELDFMQEGWRFQINDQGQKQIKGIVFNQMKGAYQSAERQLMITLNESLFAGTGYRYDSGGKPDEIVNLTYNQLVNMYKYFYHPSNMSLFFYGNNNIAKSLKQLSENYLSSYPLNPIYNHGQVVVPDLPRQHFKTIYSSSAQCNSISLFFYIKNLQQLTAVQSLTFKILQYLMLQKNSSYVYQKFIENGIAQNLGYSGFNQSKLSSFGFTLKGVEQSYQPKKYLQDVMNIFLTIIKQGVNQKRLNQFLHQLQIGIQTPKQNNGIKLLGQCLNHMNHRVQLIDHLTPLKYVQQAKQTLLNKDKLSAFLSKYFMQNKHYVVVQQLITSEQMNEKPTKKIQSQIKTPDQEIKHLQQQLKNRQSQVQDVSILPKLLLCDLVARKRIQPHQIQSLISGNRHIKYFHIPIQNQIHFYRFVFNFKTLPFDINDKLGIWNFLINKGISTKHDNYKQLSSKFGQFTAGLHTSVDMGTKGSINVVLSVASLKRNKEQLFKLMEQIFFQPVFQDQNVKNLYRSFQNQAVQALTDSPIKECIDQCGSSLNLSGRLFNKYQQIKVGLKQTKDENLSSLRQLNELLVESESITLIQHSNERASKLPSLFKRFQTESKLKKLNPLQFSPQFLSKSITHNFDVNFCSQQYIGPQYLSKDHAKLLILVQFLEQEYLHPEIRQKGGAYGARASIRQSGNICLYSYMDPESLKTFKIFDQSVEKLKNIDTIQSDKLDEIKINIIGQLQRLKIPQEECVRQILKGYSVEQFLQFQQWVKESSASSIIEMGRKYLNSSEKSRCMFGKQVPIGFTQQKLSDFI